MTYKAIIKDMTTTHTDKKLYDIKDSLQVFSLTSYSATLYFTTRLGFLFSFTEIEPFQSGLECFGFLDYWE